MSLIWMVFYLLRHSFSIKKEFTRSVRERLYQRKSWRNHESTYLLIDNFLVIIRCISTNTCMIRYTIIHTDSLPLDIRYKQGWKNFVCRILGCLSQSKIKRHCPYAWLWTAVTFRRARSDFWKAIGLYNKFWCYYENFLSTITISIFFKNKCVPPFSGDFERTNDKVQWQSRNYLIWMFVFVDSFDRIARNQSIKSPTSYSDSVSMILRIASDHGRPVWIHHTRSVRRSNSLLRQSICQYMPHQLHRPTVHVYFLWKLQK